jgi:hypothetical protein
LKCFFWQHFHSIQDVFSSVANFSVVLSPDLSVVQAPDLFIVQASDSSVVQATNLSFV